MFSKSPPNSKVTNVPVDIFGDSSALCGLGSLECLVQRLIGQMAFRLFLVRTDEVGHQQPVQIDYVNDNWKKRAANIEKEAFPNISAILSKGSVLKFDFQRSIGRGRYAKSDLM